MINMNVFGVDIPNKALTNIELEYYAKELKIPHFRGVFMRDTLPKKTKKIECGIVNLNTSKENGSHWTAYFKKARRIYFDSYGQITPIEIQNYLKTRSERGIGVIQRKTDIVQSTNTVKLKKNIITREMSCSSTVLWHVITYTNFKVEWSI